MTDRSVVTQKVYCVFRTIRRLLFPNPLDWGLYKIGRKGKRKILLGWNRGLGDIALGLYAIVYRIRERIPHAEVTFLTRPNLADGFKLLENVRVCVAPDWERKDTYSVRKTLVKMCIDPKSFDWIIDRPSPTDWVQWQRGKLVPKLKWDPAYDELWESFALPPHCVYICVQPVAETEYGVWRNWPLFRWHELFQRLAKFPNVKILLFGYSSQPEFSYQHVIDLRGKTNLFQLLSLIKNQCHAAVLPDSGILSILFYLDTSFPIRVVSLWADPNHGILKQGVASPNPQLIHCPCLGEKRDLSSLSAAEVIRRIFPAKPLETCPKAQEIQVEPVQRTGVILLAGGQGSRLGTRGPKGIYQVLAKSLFQWISERVARDIPIAVMTSPLNHLETVAFFQKHQFFGREVHFFQQRLLPMLDRKKRPLRVLAPDGNGGVYKSFSESGIMGLFEERGIDLVSIVPVDNPLADPTDPFLVSYMRQTDADIIVKCIERQPSDVPMGALVTREGRIEVVEYTELDPQVSYRYSYTGMMALKLSFLKQIAHLELPFHWVWKQSGNVFGWKREQYVFDVLPFADQARALCYSRQQIYAPIKREADVGRVVQAVKVVSNL